MAALSTLEQVKYAYFSHHARTNLLTFNLIVAVSRGLKVSHCGVVQMG